MGGFKFEISVPSDGYLYTFKRSTGSSTGLNYSIDWGDGNSTTGITANTQPTHTYETAGLYIIEITGTCPGAEDMRTWTELKRIVAWGDKPTFAGFPSAPRLQDNTSIERIEDGSIIFSNLDTTSFSNFCSGCTKLIYVGDGIFDLIGSQIVNLSFVFYNTKITSIPEGIFDNCTNSGLLDCSYVFGVSLLTIIPSNLFDSLVYATDFSYAFYNTPIKEIPNALFDKNVAATNFINTFALCPLAKINPYIFYGPEINSIYNHTKETRFLNKTVNFNGLFGRAILSPTGIVPFAGIINSDYLLISSIGFGGGGGASTNSTANTAGPANSGRGGGACYNNGTPGKGGSGFIGIRYFDGAESQQVNLVDVGSSTWLVPTGVTEIELFLVAGGGGGSGYGSTNGHGGGGGGVIFKKNLQLSDLGFSAGDSIPFTIGDGGNGAISNSTDGSDGANSTFGNITAFGGAGGMRTAGSSTFILKSGGSGGGGRLYTASASNNNGLSRQGQGTNGKYNETSPYLAAGGGSLWIKANDNNILPDLWNCDFGTGSASDKQIAISGLNKYNTLNFLDVPVAWGGLTDKFVETFYQVSETELIVKCENVVADRFSVFEQGFVYSETANPTVLDSKITFEKSEVNRFDQIIGKISGLTADTTIYVRSYFITEYGTFYGDDNEIVLSDINIAQPFEFEIETISENTVFSLSNSRITGTSITSLDYVIDFGNGDLIAYKDGTNPSSNYATPGVYSIKVFGESGGLSGFASISILKRIVNWGSPDVFKGLCNFPSFQSSGLFRVEDGVFNYHIVSVGQTSITYCFAGCSQLEYIGEGIFDNLSNIVDASNLFLNCTKLKSISYRIFDSMVNATSFTRVFSGCTNLRYLPAGLFDKNTAVTSFEGALSNCNKLSNIEYLFYGPEVNEVFTHTKETRFFNKTISFSTLFGASTQNFVVTHSNGFPGKYLGDIFPGYGKNGYFAAGGNGSNSTVESSGQTATNTNPLPNTGCGAAAGTTNTRKGASGIVLIRYKNEDNDYVIDAITTLGAGSWIKPAYVNFIDVLVVAGGGGAYSSTSGGGGGGGLIYKEDYDVRALGSAISVYVGDGGAAGLNNGQNSSFGSLIAIGGGYGGGLQGGNGGSGGGCASSYSEPLWNPGMGVLNQGSQGYKPSAAGNPSTGGGGAGFAALFPRAYPDLWNCNYGTGSVTKGIVPWYGNRENITNYDFIPADWGGNPILSNFSITKISDSEYEFDVNLDTWAGDYYFRILSINDNIEVYNQTGLHHEFSFELATLKKNYKAQLMLEYAEGLYTAISTKYFGQTFTRTIALDPDFYIEGLSANLGYQVGDSAWIHGSLYFDGYWYGLPRKEMSTTAATKSLLVRVPKDDYQNWEYIDIATSEYDSILYDGESLCRIGNYIFGVMVPYPQESMAYEMQNPLPDTGYLIILDSVTFTHKLIPFPATGGIIYSDGEYLYRGYGAFYKIDPAPFISAFSIFPNKTVLSNEDKLSLTSGEPMLEYSDDTQGGYIDFPRDGYTRFSKGYVHAAVIDANYLYLSYTTGPNSGYDPDALLKGVHELHVVNKHTMQAAGWCYIPKSTDDMTQTGAHLFFGIEVQTNANVETYGYGWGTYAIKKSDVININHSSGYVNPIKSLSPLYFNDNPPFVQSYASLIFGNYILDFKTNKNVYILDITDVDNWSFSDPIGSRTLGVIDFTINGGLLPGVPNEAAVDENGHFHAFIWKRPSGAMRWDITEINPFAPPTVNTLTADITGYDVTMNGYILNENGQAVTDRGFEWGVGDDPDLWVDSESIGIIGAFELTEGFSPGTYYYRAYATNSEGTGYGSITMFSVAIDSPEVTTVEATSITANSASSGGINIETGGGTISAKGVVWSTNPNPTTALETKTNDGDDAGDYISLITGLDRATEYYYRAYVTNEAGTAYGIEYSFVTLAEQPSVDTALVSDILTTTATCGGTITDDGDSAILAAGVVWSTNPNPTTALETKTVDDVVDGSFVSNLTSLSEATTYYVRAYATNAVGTSYGTERTFVTESSGPELPAVAITYIDSLTSSSILVTGSITNDGGGTISAKGFAYSTAENPTIENSLFTDEGGGTANFGSTLSDLDRVTTYYVRAYATNEAGTAYSSQSSEITLGESPVVVTYQATEVGENSATLNGELLDDGGLTITVQGFVWGLTSNPTFGVDSFIPVMPGMGEFDAELTGLTSGVPVYYRSYVANTIDSDYGLVMTFTPEVPMILPIVSSLSSSVTDDSVMLNGEVTDDGGLEVLEQGFEYGQTLSPDETWISNETSLVNPYQLLLTNLDDGIYYWRAYAVNENGSGYGEIQSFEIITVVVTEPTVTADEPTVDELDVTFTGTIVSNGGADVTDKGFQWGTDPLPSNWDGEDFISIDPANPFTAQIEFAEGTYYFRAYAVNRIGPAYSNVQSFETIAKVIPTVTTSPAEVTGSTVDLSGVVVSSGNDVLTEKGFEWGQTENPAEWTASQQVPVNDPFEVTISLPAGVYYYRAYAVNSKGRGNGSILSFEVTETQQTLAVLNGTPIIKIYLGNQEIIKIILER